ncbi:MAG: 3'(2'),5'-bisphosphate nucleotidase CysQ, partial [Hyphomicrobiales bacterium]|nr:3'(2'),5'-bisphosphate nucleotidase CysQ [Hyphomicrobiales bacterium]
DYGWLSEETADTAERLSRRRLFVVDPIDGTRGFVEGIDDWTVSVAVVEDGRPVAGALYNPVADELYAAEAGRGARLNDRPIRVSGQSRLYGARIAGPSRLAASKALKDAGVRPADWIHSLALRFARVAAGRLDAAVARPDARDWDLAAADLLVHEAGGRLAAPNGTRPGYNRPDPRHGVLIAGGPDLFGLLSAELAAVG